ncbi:hypothetical protein PbB2_01196 [Candidatus Phycosocius bacilliformis]|uniref:Lipoprotein n=1 Tax=Candidatus Phycosocius bacilliformis TaxID=1445552 RepID=A0A2P2E8Y1_9PROT|nr:hypothetical protein [Candidatus Phycosocius bacilliformis]GBF57529.1 hypothetical protein PbB2_01196 [Candidatus Phycosocius bacilliformis]
MRSYLIGVVFLAASLTSCSGESAHVTATPEYTLDLCAWKPGYQSTRYFDPGILTPVIADIQESLKSNVSRVQKAPPASVGPWKQHVDKSLTVARDAGMDLGYYADVRKIGLADLSGIEIAPQSQISVRLVIGSPELNRETSRDWLNIFDELNQPSLYALSQTSMSTIEGTWRFHQEKEVSPTFGGLRPYIMSPEHLWRCMVAQEGQNIMAGYWVSCDLFYPHLQTFAQVGFERPLLCHTPEIASKVDALIQKIASD